MKAQCVVHVDAFDVLGEGLLTCQRACLVEDVWLSHLCEVVQEELEVLQCAIVV